MISNLINKLKLLNIKIDVVDSKLDIKALKGAIDASLLEDIKLHKEELIDYIKIYKAKKVSHLNIKAAPLKASYPLSSAQKRLWLVSQIEEYSIAYNIPSCKFLDGNYSIENLKKAIDATIERHEILRTVFKENEDGDVNQWVLSSKELGFKIDYVDLTNTENQNAGIRNYIHQDSIKPFDLEKGPLLRAALLQLSENKHAFYYNMHHIISDGWSIEVMIKDVLAYYKSYVEGSTVELSDLKIQYKDYSVWQLEQMEKESHHAHKTYWEDQFSGELPTINLNTSNKRPLVKGSKGKRLGTYISKENSQNLKQFCQQKGGSLFMGLLANLNALFYKNTAQNDIIIGTPIAGRDHLDLENQIGFYVNTLALRNNVNPNESFDQLLENIKKNTLKAYEHQEYPFDQLVEDLNLKRDISRSLLFDVMMVLQNKDQESSKVAVPEETVNAITDFGETTSKFDLEIFFQEIGDCISFQITYNSDVYDKEMIEAFLSHYKQLLETSLKYPHQKLLELNYLTESEKQQLLFGFNDTKVLHSEDKTLVDLFEEQAAKTPNNTAVIFEDTILTYQQLNEKSNQLAAYLRANHTIEPDDLIAVKLERNEFLLVSLLGVLKSGAAYVPIDSNYPQQRIDYIEKDSNSKVVIDQNLVEKFLEVQDNYSTSNLDQISKSNHLAYIIYTSGTTGNPKGVMVEHHNAVELIHWSIKEYNADKFDIVYAVTSHCFDLSVYEFFYTLSIGKKLRILKNALEIDYYLEQDKNILLNTVPSVVRKLIEDKVSLDNITVINMAGEILPTDIIAKLPLDKIEVRNLYGPSEDTTYSTCYFIADKEARTISIGQPISNTQVLILDQNNQLVPIGVTGRIFVSGAGVARGYLNKEELTQEKFVDNSFIAGERMYDTGDLGYWLPDGNIEFIGRKDHQVKIRGYRIELGEIESAILGFSDQVQQAVLEAKEFNSQTVLVAYYVSETKIDKTDLRSYLQSKLPDYMLPGYYLELDKMPLTPNGKTDRKALPGISGEDLIRREYVAPTTAIEIGLAKIWEEVLNVEKLGIHDDFFELGGHSIKLGKLINTYQKKFDVKLSFSQLFKNTSLISHAGLISKSGKLKYKEIEKVAISKSYPLSDAQRRLWVLSQFEQNSIAYNMPSYHVLEGGYDIDNLKKAIDATIDRHEILRTVFRENESGEIQQWILNREAINFKIDYCDFSTSDNKQLSIKEYIQKDSKVAFDLENGPLLRASLLQLSENNFVFYYNMHHIISDGWSMDILTKDVLAYYKFYTNSTTPNLPELRIQYKDYSVWQLNQLKETSHKAHQLFWLDKLSGELPVIDLPSTKKRPVVKTNNGERLGTYLSKNISHDLKTFCQEKGGSLFMGLVASLNALFYRYTSQEDFIIGSPVAGRDHIDLENQIGFYLNMIPLRNKINPENDFDALFEDVKSVVLDTYEHKQYPFDRLVEDLELQRDMGRSAIFDVVIMLQNVGEKTTNSNVSEEFTNTISSLGKSVSKFDIEINFEEVGDLISFQINYNTDVYDNDIIIGFMKHYIEILKAVLQSPAEPIYKVDYLSAIEKKQVLEDFNSNKREVSKALTIVDLFANQVKENPDNTALVFKNKKLSYKELDEVSDQLSYYLLSAYNIQIEDFIGVKLERNEWLVIALLSVLKTGAAYVPIDPAYPVERMKYIEKDANCKIVIDQELLEAFERTDIKNEPFKIALTPENLAYVIYTSGSTGMPKGVMIEHRNAVSFLSNLDFELGFKGYNIVAGTTNVVFDISFLEIFGTLCSGRKLIFFSSEELMSPELFMDTLHDNKIEVLQVTPSRFSQISEVFASNPSPYLKQLLMGGEPFPRTVYDNLNKYSDLNITNVYGPTETTIWSTSLDINSSKYLSIGKPMANENVLILSNKLQIQPIGVVGELYISGDGLARGYLNKEQLTNEKFIENPYNKGTKIYGTGDLARWRLDGNIEYAERKDDQVKIRGHRIELGEIENVLLQQKEIEQAIVLVKEKEGEKFIISYLVGHDMDIEAIRMKLAEFLPSYMLPSYFVILDKMPLNSSGKTDKKALLAIDKMETSSKNYVAPRTKEEKIVISICEKLLKKENISINENFYNIGGDSLKIIQLMNQLNREGYAIKVEQVFKTPDFEALAKVITLRKNSIELDLTEDAIFNSELDIANEKINWKIGDKVQISENQKYVMKLKNSEGFIGPFKIQKSGTEYIESQLREFLNNFPDLNIEFVKEGDFIYQKRVSYQDLKIAVSSQDLDFSNTVNISQAIANEIPLKPYDFFEGELIRLFVFNDINESNESYIHIAISHIIADMYTCNVLQQELKNFMGKNKILKNQYPASGFDFALWQQKYLISETGLKDRFFWINDLKKSNLELLSNQKSYKLKKHDYTSESKKVLHTTQKIVVTGQKFEQIKQLAQNLNIPLSGLFMGFHQYLIQECFKEQFHFQLITVSGRESIVDEFDTSEVLGAFNNVIPLRLISNANDSFYDLFQNVYLNYLNARMHQIIPYETIREDFFVETKIDMDLCRMAGVNFHEIQGTFEENKTNKLILGTQILSSEHPLDIICKVRDNGIEIGLVYQQNDGVAFRLDSLLENVIDKISTIK
ncbi:amino acid adenylation domain-containing protein [Flavobacterium sp. MC2016-06]|jgi:amino acid adenylation domain-containing protein|uniref:amino acid adenylation domain-containing protein n=1 Tax=Flavobacterium sp. MC2016-06 TaxID=2676308 RepID=UPI0031D7E86A